MTPVVNTTGSFNTSRITVELSSLYNSSFNQTGLYKNGNNLVRLTSGTNLTWSLGFTFSSITIPLAWPNPCSGDITSEQMYLLSPMVNQFCGTPNRTIIQPVVDAFYHHSISLRSDRWLRILSILPGLNLSVSYCKFACEIYTNGHYQLVPEGTYYYEPYTTYPSYHCTVLNCVSVECSNPNFTLSNPPCNYIDGVPRCTSNISFFSTSSNNFTSSYSNEQFYCVDSSGQCYALPNSSWTFNYLSFLLLGISVGLFVAVAVALIYYFGNQVMAPSFMM